MSLNLKLIKIIRITRLSRQGDINDSEKVSGSTLTNFEIRRSLKSTLPNQYYIVQKQIVGWWVASGHYSEL